VRKRPHSTPRTPWDRRLPRGPDAGLADESVPFISSASPGVEASASTYRELEARASAARNRVRSATFRQGLIETGYVPGQNVAVEYRWAANQLDRLPAFAIELVRRPVSVIAALGTASAQAAKAASTTVPVVFLTADDPVRLGLVASLNRPGANLTGVSFVSAMLGAKLLELLRTLVPKADLIAVLVDPNSAESQNQTRGVEEAGRALGQQGVFVNATPSEIERAFITVAQRGAGALLVSGSPSFGSQRHRIAAISAI
jgi:putative tryptophan/tyrosine transport system substrate-binding protein